MHPPQKLQPVRAGPSPPKYGSGTSLPASPKKTATSVGWKVFAQPISAAISRQGLVGRRQAGVHGDAEHAARAVS